MRGGQCDIGGLSTEHVWNRVSHTTIVHKGIKYLCTTVSKAEKKLCNKFITSALCAGLSSQDTERLYRAFHCCHKCFIETLFKSHETVGTPLLLEVCSAWSTANIGNYHISTFSNSLLTYHMLTYIYVTLATPYHEKRRKTEVGTMKIFQPSANPNPVTFHNLSSMQFFILNDERTEASVKFLLPSGNNNEIR